MSLKVWRRQWPAASGEERLCGRKVYPQFLEKHACSSDYHPTLVGGGVQSLHHLPEPKKLNYAGERMTNIPEKLNGGFVGQD